MDTKTKGNQTKLLIDIPKSKSVIEIDNEIEGVIYQDRLKVMKRVSFCVYQSILVA